jgi:pilus assembly protein CpaF
MQRLEEAVSIDAIIEDVRQTMVKKHGNAFLALSNKYNLESYNRVSNLIKEETKRLHCNEETEDTIIASLLGLGAVDVLLKDPLILEIMVNRPDEIYIDKNGTLKKTELSYRDEQEVLNLIFRIVQRCGRRINFSSPLVTARLPDGSRVNATISPASEYPTLTIRRYLQHVFPTDELISKNFISPEEVVFFDTVVRGKANIVICGATFSGKTSLLRWLAQFIPESERVIVIEAIRELNLQHPHLISLEESDKASIYDLMINVFHMRPDRIILGEILGAEAFELLQAMGTGHDGSLTTVHSNYGLKQAVSRMVRAMAKAQTVAPEELRSMIAEAVDLLVFVKRFPDGSRHIVEVAEVDSDDNGRPIFREIFHFRKKSNTHYQVGCISKELLHRIEDNIGNVPNIPSLGGGLNI